MSIFNSPYFDCHEKIMIIADDKVGLRAIIAIHDMTLGPAIGGTRFWHYQSDQDALDDALRLSQGMTYKAALAGISAGGGKAVILADPQKHKSRDLLVRYARELNALQGQFLTGEDVGIDMVDIEIMAEVSPFVKGTKKDKSGDPSSITAYGVVQGMKAALSALTGDERLSGKRVAIQGLGKVGLALATLLRDESVRVIACDVDKAKADAAKETLGIEIVDPDAIYEVEADLFAPCGLGSVLNLETIPRLKTRIVAGSANNQLKHPAMGEQLRARNILYAPDYVINAGGLINVCAAGPSYQRDRVLRQVEGIYQTLTRIFQASSLFKFPTNLVADQIAQDVLRERRHFQVDALEKNDKKEKGFC